MYQRRSSRLLSLPGSLAIALVSVAACHSYPGGPVLPKPDPGQVEVGYGTKDKRDVNAAVSKADAEQLMKNQPRTVTDMLVGRFAGVDVKQLANGGTSVRIRGSRSFKGSQEPLIVLDGTPQHNGTTSLLDLTPQDIRSIEVLKDAAAAAVYGSRGANGVILIATKRGQ